MKRATTRRASPPKDPKPAEAAEALKLPMLGRDLEEDAELLVREDGKTGGISFSLSSEAPVERFFGTEILSHDAGAIRLKRAKRGAMPLLFNHDWQDPVGMIENARVEEKRLVVDANFFNTERGQEVAQMVTDGLRNVSVGYRVYKFQVDTKSRSRLRSSRSRRIHPSGSDGSWAARC
jgi:HK97 family phage prohead protease